MHFMLGLATYFTNKSDWLFFSFQGATQFKKLLARFLQ
jgi:hypothetical protein